MSGNGKCFQSVSSSGCFLFSVHSKYYKYHIIYSHFKPSLHFQHVKVPKTHTSDYKDCFGDYRMLYFVSDAAQTITVEKRIFDVCLQLRIVHICIAMHLRIDFISQPITHCTVPE